jgi:phospholipid/cholesterol/gamma-HCH transport system substrate-binding protein
MEHLDARQQLTFGLAALVLVAAMFVLGIQVALGAFGGGYTLTAEFDRTGQGLTTFSDVRMRGIAIGKVRDIRVNEHGRAVVTMRIRDGIDIPEDATLTIGALSVFGPKIVNVVPNPDSRMEIDGPYLQPDSALTVERTQAPTDLEGMLVRTDEILAGINTADLHTAIHTLAEIVDGQGTTFGNVLDHSSVLIDLADRNTDRARQMMGDLAILARMVEGRGGDLVGALGNTNAILAELNTREDTFAELLAATSEFSREITSLLERHRDDIELFFEGLAQGVLPTLRSLSAEAQNLPVFGDAVGGFLGLLGEVIHLVNPDGSLSGGIELLLKLDEPCSLLPIC